MMPPVRRAGAAALASCALVAQAPAPPAAPNAGGALVQALAGTFACRSVEGVIVRETGTREGDAIVVREDVERNGRHAAYEDRFVYDAALQRWHVATGLGGFSADATPPTAAAWAVYARNADGLPVKMEIEDLGGGDFRRTFAYDRGRSAPDWFAYSVERCTPGSVPPPPTACIAERYPPTTLEVAPPPISAGYGDALPGGRVEVVVSLDEASRITRLAVRSSTASVLNIPAMDRVRRSRFRTAIVNCKPVAADYIFTVDF